MASPWRASGETHLRHPRVIRREPSSTIPLLLKVNLVEVAPLLLKVNLVEVAEVAEVAAYASNLSFDHDPEMDEDESGAYPAEDFRYRGPDGCELILRIGMSGYNNARVNWTNCADHGCPFSQELMTQVK